MGQNSSCLPIAGGPRCSRPLLLSSLLVRTAFIPARRSGEEESGSLILAAARKKSKKSRVSTSCPSFLQIERHPALRPIAGRRFWGENDAGNEPLLVDLPLLKTLQFLAGGAQDGV